MSTTDEFLGDIDNKTDDVEKKRTIEDDQEQEYVLALLAVDNAKQNNASKETIEALEKEKDNKKLRFYRSGIDVDVVDARRAKRELSKKDKSAFKTFSQIIAEGLGLDDEPDYVNVKAMSTLIKKDTVAYMLCLDVTCRETVVDENNGTYRCKRCNKTYNNLEWSYMVSAEISDATGAQWITVFGNEAETLLGMTANDFGNHILNQNESIIEDIIRKAMNHERIFKLRAKAEQHNNERKIRFTCVGVSDVDWPSHGRRLIEEINRMEPMVILPDEDTLLRRHIGAACENRYRAQQRTANQESYLSPELLRGRWIELFNEQNRDNQT
ncbi:unnamed protein product [Rotaria sordida]|nr:unnamed protein product [Rotaria sordida]CAF1423200.1 unnamed protein product [Rotaria sordida]